MSDTDFIHSHAGLLHAAKSIRTFFLHAGHGWYRKIKKVGLNSRVGKPIHLNGGAFLEIGENTVIGPNAWIDLFTETNGQTFTPHVKIGDGVGIMNDFYLSCGTEVIIEDGVGIGPFVMINDATHQYFDKDTPIIRQPLDAKPIRIGEGTNIGAHCSIQAGVTIGKHCHIGANTVITKDVPDYTIVTVGKQREVQIPY